MGSGDSDIKPRRHRVLNRVLTRSPGASSASERGQRSPLERQVRNDMQQQISGQGDASGRASSSVARFAFQRHRSLDRSPPSGYCLALMLIRLETKTTRETSSLLVARERPIHQTPGSHPTAEPPRISIPWIIKARHRTAHGRHNPRRISRFSRSSYFSLSLSVSLSRPPARQRAHKHAEALARCVYDADVFIRAFQFSQVSPHA